MRIQMDADGSQASGGFTLVPEGDYVLEVAKAEGQKSKKGLDQANLRLNILDLTGKKVGSCFETITFIPKGEAGHGIWLHINKAFGMPWDGAVDFDTDAYVGKSAKGKVVVESYTKSDGTANKKNKVAVYYTDSNPAPKPAVIDYTKIKKDDTLGF